MRLVCVCVFFGGGGVGGHLRAFRSFYCHDNNNNYNNNIFFQ